MEIFNRLIANFLPSKYAGETILKISSHVPKLLYFINCNAATAVKWKLLLLYIKCFLGNLLVKEFCKSVHISWSYDKTSTVLFFWLTVHIILPYKQPLHYKHNEQYSSHKPKCNARSHCTDAQQFNKSSFEINKFAVNKWKTKNTTTTSHGCRTLLTDLWLAVYDRNN